MNVTVTCYRIGQDPSNLLSFSLAKEIMSEASDVNKQADDDAIRLASFGSSFEN